MLTYADEAVVAGGRTREEALEGDLLAAQNEIVRLRFESEHAELRLQRWQRRVREHTSAYVSIYVCRVWTRRAAPAALAAQGEAVFMLTYANVCCACSAGSAG